MIVDKRKAVIENFKEEFSVFKAIETLEDLGYKVLKDIPLDLAESAITEAGKKVLTEAELEEIEKQAEAKVEEALKPETLVEKLEEAGYTVLSEAELSEVEDVMVEKVIESLDAETIVEKAEEKGFIVLSEEQLDEVEAKFEEKLLEKLEAEGNLLIRKDEIAAFDEELAKIIDEKVKEALELKEEDDEDEDGLETGDDEGHILDDEADEACKKDKKESSTMERVNKPLFEKLIEDKFEMGDVKESDVDGEDEIADVADKATDADGDGEADKTDDEAGKTEENLKESVKAGEKGSLLESLV